MASAELHLKVVPDFTETEKIAYEMGYRARLIEEMSEILGRIETKLDDMIDSFDQPAATAPRRPWWKVW